MKKIMLLLICMSCFLYAHAQLGINVNSPNERAMLDIMSNDSDPKGVLFPRLTPTVINQLKNSLNSYEQSGMMVYDTACQHLFIMKPIESLNTISFQKHIVDPWFTNSNINRDTFKIYLSESIEKIGIGTKDPQDQLHLSETLRAYALKTSELTNEQANREDTIQLIGNLKTEQTITANTFEGHGTIPKGGIIMWSGDPHKLPEGWALCDGNTKIDGKDVPDLSGRFIVSYSASIAEYDIRNTGGEDSVTLKVEQMPAHSHKLEYELPDIINYKPDSAYTAYPFDNFLSDKERETKELYKPNINIMESGGDKPHENRPRYYVLAFIIRVN